MAQLEETPPSVETHIILWMSLTPSRTLWLLEKHISCSELNFASGLSCCSEIRHCISAAGTGEISAVHLLPGLSLNYLCLDKLLHSSCLPRPSGVGTHPATLARHQPEFIGVSNKNELKSGEKSLPAFESAANQRANALSI